MIINKVSSVRAFLIHLSILFFTFSVTVSAAEVEDYFPASDWISKVQYGQTNYIHIGIYNGFDLLKLFERTKSFRQDKTNPRNERNEVWAVLTTNTLDPIEPGPIDPNNVHPSQTNGPDALKETTTYRYLQINRRDLSAIKKNLRQVDFKNNIVIEDFICDATGPTITFRKRSQSIIFTCGGSDAYPMIDEYMLDAKRQLGVVLQNVQNNGNDSPF